MFRALRHAMTPRKVAFLATLVAVTACTLNTDVSGPATLVKVTGDQTGPTSTTLTTPLAVLVATQFGEPVRDYAVTWTVVSGGGTLSATTMATDNSGISSVTYTTGPTAGEAVIQARVSGLPPLTFRITVT